MKIKYNFEVNYSINPPLYDNYEQIDEQYFEYWKHLQEDLKVLRYHKDDEKIKLYFTWINNEKDLNGLIKINCIVEYKKGNELVNHMKV